MDDGSEIRLAVTIDKRDGSAIFDFAGTGPEVYGNCNAPPAVAYSAIIYSLRCMVRPILFLDDAALSGPASAQLSLDARMNVSLLNCLFKLGPMPRVTACSFTAYNK